MPASHPVQKILLVDDLKENLLALEGLLQDKPLISNGGTELHRALSGREALELLLEHDFALALIDVQMPEMNGFELAQAMRSTARTRAIPIIFVTAGDRNPDWQFTGYDTGAVDFLYKPLDPRIVQSKVRVFLELDLKSRKLAEELQASELARRKLQLEQEMRDRFVATLSHDLRTPLASAKLAVQLIQRKPPTPEQLAKSTDNILRSFNRAERMISDLLDANRLEAGKALPLEIAPLELNALVKSTLHELATLHGDRFVLREDSGPIQGYWDGELLRRAIENLASNAVKYGDAVKPITVTLEQRNGEALIGVQNWGDPLTPEDQAKLFDAYHRSKRAEESGKKGWGIGLTLVLGITRSHGGKVAVKSSREEGTRFTLSIPVDCRRSGEAANPA